MRLDKTKIGKQVSSGGVHSVGGFLECRAKESSEYAFRLKESQQCDQSADVCSGHRGWRRRYTWQVFAVPTCTSPVIPPSLRTPDPRHMEQEGKRGHRDLR